MRPIEAVLTLCCLWMPLRSNGQVELTSIPQQNSSIPVLSKQQIDGIPAPSEGFMAMCSTDHCLYYYLHSTWFQLCGTCLPLPGPYSIDSLRVSGMMLSVYFKVTEGDTLSAHIHGQKERVRSSMSPIRLRIPSSKDSVTVVTTVGNRCHEGKRPMETPAKVGSERLGPVMLMPFGSRTVGTRKLGKVVWSCEDLVQPEQASSLTKPLVAYGKARCPDGWRLPTEAEFVALLSLVEGDPEEAFASPEVGNSSIGLSRFGAFDEAGNQAIQQDEMGSYWLAGRDAKGAVRLINITALGYMLISADEKGIRLNCRCVKDD